MPVDRPALSVGSMWLPEPLKQSRFRASPVKAHRGFFLWIRFCYNLVFQVLKLKEQLETTVQKLNESKEVLKTNENGETSFVSIFSLMISAVNKITKISE